MDVNEVVRRTLQLLENQEEARGVNLETNLTEPLPKVRGDAEQLRQVFLNLALNAIQAMRGEGRLTVSTLHAPPRRVDAGAFIEVRFHDTGPGIAREHLKNLLLEAR